MENHTERLQYCIRVFKLPSTLDRIYLGDLKIMPALNYTEKFFPYNTRPAKCNNFHKEPRKY